MRKLIEKIEKTQNIDEKIRLLEALRGAINIHLRAYRKHKNSTSK